MPAKIKRRKAKPFRKLTAAQKRVVVARDAITQLRMRTLRATPGNYISQDALTKVVETLVDPYEFGDSFKTQKAVLKLRKCGVCAKGAAAICAIRKYDGVDYSGLSALSGGHMESIDDIFPQDMLDDMESAFEVEGLLAEGTTVRNATLYGYDSTRIFGIRFKNPHRRLIEIFKNVVENRGEFVV